MTQACSLRRIKDGPILVENQGQYSDLTYFNTS